MNTFNKKSLYAAIAGLGALGVTSTADAVHVNPDGLGQVLIYPYYTTRYRTETNPFNSLLSVVNSTASAKAVKVRFLEGRNSREVLDFNLYLSAQDVWTTGIIPTADGAGIVTFDKSCTTPTVSSNAASPTPFVNFAYSGDGAGDELDRTREGYVEIIEMGDVTGPTEDGVTHSGGVPPCTGLADSVAATNTVLGSGGLFGTMVIINVNASAETGVDAVALEAFRLIPPNIWNPPGSILPDLTQALPPQAEVYQGGTVVVATFTTGIDAVSAALMHDNVMNEYVLDTGTLSLTDWVLTYPTKRYYVANGTGVPPKLFQRNFGASGACDDVGIQYWDREEQTPGGPSVTFSPPSPGTPPSALCWEANVVTFNNSNLFASANSRNITVNFQNGWAQLNLVGGAATPIHRLISVAGQTFNGLPVVGFATWSYSNGNIVGPTGNPLQSAYAASFKHKTTRLIN